MKAAVSKKSKILRRVLILLGALLGLLLLLLAGLIIWLQSDQAEKFLAGLLTEQLAAQGLYLSMDELEGPLPRRLYVRNLSLADGRGTWLTVKELEVRVKLVSLLKWQLNLPLLRLEEPNLIRLPDGGEPAAQQAAESAPTEKGGPFKLPIAFRLGSINLNHGRIGQELLGLAAPENGPEAMREPAASTAVSNPGETRKSGELPPMSLALHGSGTVSNSGISANLEASLLHPDGSGFRVSLLTGPPESFSRSLQEILRDKARDSQAGGETVYWPLGLTSEDRMILSLSARENGRGFLAELFGQPDLPAYELQLRGFGAPQDWRGRLFLAAGKRGGLAATDKDDFLDEFDQGFIEPTDRLGTLNGEFGLLSDDQSISFDEILNTRLTADLKLKAEAGSLAPPELAALLRPALQAALRAHINKRQPDIEFAELETAGWSLALRQLNYQSDPGRGMVLDGDLKADIKDASFLAALQPGTSAEEYSFIEKAEIDTRIHYESGNQAVNEPMRLTAEGKGAARLSGENLDIGYYLDGSYAAGRPATVPSSAGTSAGPGAGPGAQKNGPAEKTAELGGTGGPGEPDGKGGRIGSRLEVDEFRLDALGVKANGQARLDLESGLLNLAADLNTEAGGAWHALLSRLAAAPEDAGGAGGGIPDGQLSLRLKADSNELLQAEGNGTPQTGASRTGSSATNLTASLQGSRMVWPAGTAADLLGANLALEADLSGGQAGGYRLRLDRLEAGLLSGRGEASLRGAGNPLHWAELNGTARLEADFEISLASLEPLLGASGLSEKTAQQPADPSVEAAQTSARAPLAAPGPDQRATPRPIEPSAGAADASGSARLAGFSPEAVNRSATGLVGEARPAGPRGTTRPAGPGSGARLTLKASGPLDDLNLEADLATADLRSAAGVPLRNIGARLDGVFHAAQKQLRGKAELSLLPGELGQLRLDSGWSLDFGQGLRARIEGLLATARGLLLSADLDLELPGAGTGAASPRLDGQAMLDIAEWRTLSALSGARMSGDPARLDIAFKPEAAGQRLEASWNMGHFDIQSADTDGQGIKKTVFSLNSLKGNLDIADLFRKPSINMRADTGIGRASLLSWSSGEAAITSDASEGNFKMALYGWGRRGEQGGGGSSAGASASAQKTAGQAGARTQPPAPRQPVRGLERLALDGQFELTAPTVTLSNFVFRSNDDSVNIRLAAPATVNLSRGVSLPELKLAMAPSGSLEASAEMAGQDLKLNLALKDLSFKVLSLFTSTVLPDGEINASLDLAKKGRTIGGGAQLEASMTPAVVSVQKAEASPDLPEESVPPSATEIASGQAAKAAGVPEAEAAGGNAAQPADNLEGQPFLFRLKAELDKTPSAIFADLRPSAGHIHLKGNGSLAYAGASPEGKSAGLDFSIPLALDAAGLPTPDLKAPAGVKLAWQGHPAPLLGLFPLADREFSGYGEIDLALGGSLALPVWSGHAYLVDGRYEDKILGLMLDKIRLQATGNNRELSLLLSAGDGKNGTLALEGALKPPAGSEATLRQSAEAAQSGTGAAPQLAVRGQINHLSPLHRDDLEVQFSGILGANGPVSQPSLSAKLELERGQFTLLSSLGGGIRTLEIEEPDQEDEAAKNAGMPLDVELSIPNRFYIRGYGLESEWAGTVKAAGTTGAPLVSGQIHPVRGYFDLLSKPFAFDPEGSIRLDGTEKINPRLDLKLTYQGPSITAIVNITGTANKPGFDLTSNPVLPKDQILSEVLFGKSFSSLSRFEAIQVANSLRQLAMGGSDFDPLGAVRQTLGFDMLRISGGESTAPQDRDTYGTLGASDLGGSSGGNGNGDDESMPSLETGKYINDAIYVGVEQGVTENSTGVRVEVELRPNLTLEGRSNVQSSEVGIGWKKDY